MMDIDGEVMDTSFLDHLHRPQFRRGASAEWLAAPLLLHLEMTAIRQAEGVKTKGISLGQMLIHNGDIVSIYNHYTTENPKVQEILDLEADIMSGN